MKKYFLTLTAVFLITACSTQEDVSTQEDDPTLENEELNSIRYSDHGIEMSYPKDWEIYESDADGVLEVRVYNQAAPDGYSCSEPYLGLYVISTLRDTSVGDFDAWMKANFDEGGSLGSFGEYMNATTFKGYPAYEVGGFGWESYCAQKGYVIDYGEGHIIKVILEGEESSPAYTQLLESLESLKLTGLQDLP